MAKKKAMNSKKLTTKKPNTKKNESKMRKTDIKENNKLQTKKKLKISYWRTRLHDEELGIHQKLKYYAKTRGFSTDFRIDGIVHIDSKKEYIIAYNKEDWEEEPKDKPKRLNLRIFTIMEEKLNIGKGGNYRGGIELIITHSLVQSFELHKTAPIFFIQLPRVKSIIPISFGWRIKGTRYTWPLIPEKPGDKLQIIKAKGMVGLGRNYDLYLGTIKVGSINGQRIQKEYKVDIYDANLAKDKTFIHTVILFSCVCNFMDEIEKIIERLHKKMIQTGTSDYKIPKAELDLFRNPRMMRR